jgi:hypothetical protein
MPWRKNRAYNENMLTNPPCQKSRDYAWDLPQSIRGEIVDVGHSREQTKQTS